ncbi:MAG: hypothetical protein IJA55_02455 [Clostridia bacterium]|nr:hypothetical protein [Clostridia bacterium]
MKKLIALILVVCLVSVVFVGCRGQKDRAENNGIVTDDTSRRTDTSDRNNGNDSTSDRNTADMNGRDTSDGGILDDAGDAVSDAVRGATDAVDDILGGGNNTSN